MRRLLLLATFLLVAACSGKQTSTPTPEPSPTSTPEATASPAPTVASVTPGQDLPDASAILRNGESVPYQVCGRVTGWQRPTLDEMQRIFTDTRLGDGSLPFPAAYAYYLENAYYVQYPTANSANQEWSAFSGFWSQTGQVEHLCDPPDTAALVRQYGAPAKSDRLWYQTLELVDQHVVAMKRIGADLVVQVEPASATHESADFPYPAGPDFFDSALGFDSLQVVDTSGALLHVESRYATVPWFERVQYAAGGQLDTVILGGPGAIPSTRLAVPPGQGTLTLYAGYAEPLRAIPAGTLTGLDASGRELLAVSWPDSPALWQPLAAVDLPPETARIRIDTAGTRGQGFLWSFVLIRNGLPLPPGLPLPGN